MNATDPLLKFNTWYRTAERKGLLRRLVTFLYPPATVHQPDAMAIATATRDATPSVRMVLYKGLLEGGFVFYTNYESRKGHELQENPQAAALFHWGFPERQVRVEGVVTVLSSDLSDRYWTSRPRGSQLSGAASPQSQKISGRADLEARVREVFQRYSGKPVPRPANWGGYVLRPSRMEFWEARMNRLHDRWLYEKGPSGQWTLSQLAP